MKQWCAERQLTTESMGKGSLGFYCVAGVCCRSPTWLVSSCEILWYPPYSRVTVHCVCTNEQPPALYLPPSLILPLPHCTHTRAWILTL
jgi:hypothetical protein